jgi:hypothetical protein
MTPTADSADTDNVAVSRSTPALSSLDMFMWQI